LIAGTFRVIYFIIGRWFEAAFITGKKKWSLFLIVALGVIILRGAHYL